MQLEIELKFRVTDEPAVLAALATLNAQFGPPEPQHDTYLTHPARDFAQTDEALRLRRSGDQTVITYKGPKLDAETKTRREIELPLTGTDPAAQWGELLTLLGFDRSIEVRKLRREAHLVWQDWPVTIALDHVEQLGYFIELEVLADATQRPAATQAILALAQHLGLANTERRGYAQMMRQLGVTPAV